MHIYGTLAGHHGKGDSMTFRHLECALTVANAGSINKAAKKMLVSQPYLSGMINALEKELGFQIFARSNQGVTCTDQGSLFMEHAEAIMSELAKIESIATDRELPLKVATYYSRFITQRFLDFHNQKPDAPADRYREMGNMEVIDAVARREYSLGIIYHARSKSSKFRKLADKNNLAYHTLHEKMGTYLIMSPDHPLAHKEHITNEEFSASPVVFYDDESTMLYMIDHLKLHHTSDAISVFDRGAYTDCLLSGRYLSIINTPFPEDEKMFILKDLSYCLSKDADIEVGSAYLMRADHKPTSREAEFIKMLKG